MTDGERLVWAAAYACVFVTRLDVYESTGGPRCGTARSAAAEDAAQAAAEAVYGMRGDGPSGSRDVREMLAEMLGRPRGE